MQYLKQWLAIAVMLCLGSGAALAQGSKVGFVNSQEILVNTVEGKEGLAELETYMGTKRQEYDTKNQELNTLQQELQTKQSTLNPSALSEMQRTVEQKQIELRRFQEDIQTDLSDRQNRLLQVISGKVQQIIQDFAQQNSYDIIFMRDQTQAYVSPSLDITQEIIRLYNEKYPGKTPAPAATQQPGS